MMKKIDRTLAACYMLQLFLLIIILVINCWDLVTLSIRDIDLILIFGLDFVGCLLAVFPSIKNHLKREYPLVYRELFKTAPLVNGFALISFVSGNKFDDNSEIRRVKRSLQSFLMLLVLIFLIMVISLFVSVGLKNLKI